MSMSEKPKESDWKTFRSLVPELRERYLQEQNAVLAELLRDGAGSPTERFWEAEERTREVAKTLRACLDGHSRSRMRESMLLMYGCGMLSDADLERFSDELREWLRSVSAL